VLISQSRFDLNKKCLFSFSRALLCIIGYIRNIVNEQKKSDFKPESDLFITECSPVSLFSLMNLI
jgi:hypothetical protein